MTDKDITLQRMEEARTCDDIPEDIPTPEAYEAARKFIEALERVPRGSPCGWEGGFDVHWSRGRLCVTLHVSSQGKPWLFRMDLGMDRTDPGRSESGPVEHLQAWLDWLVADE